MQILCPAVALAQDTLSVRVIASAANVRVGPGTQHQVIAVIQQHEVLSVLDREGDWFRVQIPHRSGIAGYIHRSTVQEIVRTSHPADEVHNPTAEEAPAQDTDAQPSGSPAEPNPVEPVSSPSGRRYGLGFQSSFPAYGLSGILDLDRQKSLQAVIGIFGVLKTYAVRGIYRFAPQELHNAYAYGMLGAWTYTQHLLASSLSETVIGFGAGVGVEADWRLLSPELPPLYFNGELGIGLVDFNQVSYTFALITIGIGVHYRF